MDAYKIFSVLASTAQLFSYLLLIRVLLTWFPGVDWNNGVLSALSSLTDPYLNIFRGVIPPIGGFDISSILAFLLLNVIVDTLGGVAGNFASIGY